ncbi:hypothetical protein KY289_004773 [Solanum tuberosum]|nr:hypothetical protein KY284_000528 [Solanum tuberosum]KAH0733585.1 hypothetical protein KY289_004773 [Solanum tuberosum]
MSIMMEGRNVVSMATYITSVVKNTTKLFLCAPTERIVVAIFSTTSVVICCDSLLQQGVIALIISSLSLISCQFVGYGLGRVLWFVDPFMCDTNIMAPVKIKLVLTKETTDTKIQKRPRTRTYRKKNENSTTTLLEELAFEVVSSSQNMKKEKKKKNEVDDDGERAEEVEEEEGNKKEVEEDKGKQKKVEEEERKI